MAGGKSSTSSDFGTILGEIATKINKEVDPVRKQFMGQLQQVLSGQMFTKSTLPLIQSGVAAARQAGATSAADTDRFLASSGVAESPFAASIKALTGEQATEMIGAVPRDVSKAYLGEVPGAVANIGGQALSGLASAAQTNQTTTSSSFDLGPLLQGAGMGLGAVLGGKM